MSETVEIRIKRLHMRSMRRGIKEMDLILSGFAAANLAAMSTGELGLYEDILAENDHDIYGWICGTIAVPEPYLDLVTRIAAGAKGIVRPV